MDEALVGELQCPVCLELLTWPIILPCSHILCREPCAERLFVHGFIRCPVCRDNSFVSGGIQNLPRVISLEHIIERVRNPAPRPITPDSPGSDSTATDDEVCGPDDIVCQLCDESVRQPRRAIKSCLHCNASYCSFCLKASHPNRSPFVEHRLVEPRRYKSPNELRCLQHDALANMFCIECQSLGCLLCAESDTNTHHGHQILTVSQAVESLKTLLQDSLKNMEKSQSLIAEAVDCHQRLLADVETGAEERRVTINSQCDSLVNEVETKREFFLSDLEYEEKSKRDCLVQQIDSLRQQSASLQSLIHYANDVLRETDPCAFIQLAKSLTDKVAKCQQKMSPTVLSTTPSCVKLSRKMVDFRKEKTVIRDLAYMAVPDTPHVDVTKCSRSTSSVVLVLCAPTQDNDVIDGYRVYFSTVQDRPPDCWEMVDFKTPGETRRCGRHVVHADSAICLMHDNLLSDTVYYFAVIAYNATGASEMSEVVHCRTLSTSQSTLPVPTIVENQCRTYTYSIQLHSPSPMCETLLQRNVVGASDLVAYYLLYREASVNKIWKSISLYGRVDHRVFGLEPNTLYDFVIMACDKNSECQVSNMVTLRTERSAY